MDFEVLINDGNIAFYKSCEITELFLIRKKDNLIFNFFTIVVLEEKPFIDTNNNYLTKPIKIDEDFSLGIRRYWLDKNSTKKQFNNLKNNNEWGFEKKKSNFPKLKYLPKQFIPSTDDNRLNNVLKNNFHSGSYILEFFDEKKTNVNFLLNVNSLLKLNQISEKIKKIIPIDLSIVRDRIGNIIFQFPVTVLKANSRALSSWDGVKLDFSWHSLLKASPNCLIQIESTFDKNYMGGCIENYNKTSEQIIKIGNLDQINHIKIWRKNPSLILSLFSGTYIRDFDLAMGIASPEHRVFSIEGQMVEVTVTSNENFRKKSKEVTYSQYISNNLYDIEKRRLEATLSFKQYLKVDNSIALNDLRKLIVQNDTNGVYLWDPYLRANDIFKTLFYSQTMGVELRAIGSANSNTENVYKTGKAPIDVISQEKKLFENINNNNHGLNFEFRIQHGMYGWKFHDRFLIFPGNELNRSKVFALGTSVNSFGNEHNILQEVSHPQPVVDAFNELWEKLNNSNCIVWKFPNK